jgi:hypothetical protein
VECHLRDGPLQALSRTYQQQVEACTTCDPMLHAATIEACGERCYNSL